MLIASLLLTTAPIAEATNVEDALVVGIQSTKTLQLQPLNPVERDMMSIYDLVYESLITINDDYLPQGQLAESWETSSNGRTWTFKLRSGILFSDGTPLTAQDVVATIDYILARARAENATDKGYYQNLDYFVDSASAKDDTTVVIKTTSSRPYWGLLYALTFPVLPADRVASDNPPGTGAYQIASFDPGNYVTLTVNDNWWQMSPQVKTITVLCHQGQSDVIESYEYARVDAVFTRAIASSQYKSGTTSLAIDYRTNQLECLLMNHSAKLLSSVNVRKAIRYAVNVDKIASSVYMGMVDRTNTPFINGTWMYNSNVDSAYTVDLDAARRLLEEDGWGDSNEDGVLDKVEDGELVSLKLNLFVYEEPDDDVRIATAEMIKDQLAQIGISVTTTTMTMTGLQEKLSAGSFNLALVSFAMDPTPDYGYLLMSGNTGNYGRYRSTAMTDLCKSLRQCTTQSEYQSVLYQIQEQFTEDCPFICMFYRKGTVLTRKMYTTARDVRELELLRGIESFRP